jgi:hypothetical protein
MMFGWLRSWIAASTGRPVEAPVPRAPRPPLSPFALYGRVLGATLAALVVLGAAAGGAWYVISHRHAQWAVVVVAGDWHAHDGSPTEAFDNARRDVAAGLADIGFDKADIAQFSQRPERYPDTHPQAGDAPTIGSGLRELARRAPGGCLLYFSSHGTPQGMVLGDIVVQPSDLASLVDSACGKRPTVIVISACFSGAFVPALEGDNRMIMTAARADRSSFGCTQDDKYPYFDTCVIANLRGAHDFPDLADRVKDCVSKREAETGMTPPSEPQVFIGSQVAAKLPTWK